MILRSIYKLFHSFWCATLNYTEGNNKNANSGVLYRDGRLQNGTTIQHQ